MKPVKSFVDTFKSDVCFDGPWIWLLAGHSYKGLKKKKKKDTPSSQTTSIA